MEHFKGMLPGFWKKLEAGTVRTLLKRYVGFLFEDINLEELTVNLSGGSVNVKNLNLDILSINEEVDKLSLPFIFMNGSIGEISVNVPFGNLLNENCFVEVTDLRLTLRPKPRSGDVSLVDSMIDSMSSSVQIAQECLSQVNEEEYFKNYSKSKPSEKNRIESESEEIDVVQNFAKAIDTVFSKIKVRFNNAMIRVEYLPKSSTSGIALEIEIRKIDFFDESGFSKEYSQPTQSSETDKNKKSNVPSGSLSSKKFLIEDVSIYSDEFLSEEDITKLYTPENTVYEDPDKSVNLTMNMNDSLYKSSEVLNSSLNISSTNEILGNYSPNKTRILMAKLLNRQEIKFQFRKAEVKEMCGPKVNIETNLGCSIFFTSPRQIHLLSELINSIISPEKIDSVEILNKEDFDNSKPMNLSDFNTMEHDFIKDLSTPNAMVSHALNDRGGWSSAPDEWDEEQFFPVNSDYGEVKSKYHPLLNSTLTDTSDLNTSFVSTTSTNLYNNIGTKKDDILTNFKIKISSIYMVLLHEDIMIPCDDLCNVITDSSLAEMKMKVDTFFSNMKFNSNFESSIEEFIYLNEKAHFVCLDNHLRMVSAGLSIDGDERIISNKWEQTIDISAHWLEIKECLTELDESSQIYSDLLSFTKFNSCDNLNKFHLPVKPKLQININQSVQSSGRTGRIIPPKLNITIQLEECLTEVDISIIDRINVLLNIQDITRKKQNLSPTFQLGNQAHFQEMMKEVNSKLETITTINLKSNLLSVKLFFPIPDLRPLSNMSRIPWWKKNVRKEVLLINAADILIKSNILNKQPNFEILSSDIEFLLQETEEIPPIPIMRASSPKDIEKGFNPIRICVKSFPPKIHVDLDDIPVQEHEDISKSTMGFLSGVNSGSANLFNRRKVAFQNQGNISEIPIPSDEKEIYTYITETLKNVHHNIDIDLNDVKLILPSKHMYEVIYNRLITDLLLWTPSAPKCSSKTFSSLNTIIDDLSIGTTLIPGTSNPSLELKAFPSLKSNSLKGECESDNDDQNHNREESNKPIGQTFIGLMVKIKNAAGSIHTPYRDEDGKIIPGKFGNISFLFEKGFIFVASGYQSDVNAVQGCVKLNNVNVFHQPNNTLSHSPTQLNSDFLLSIKNMNSILQRAGAVHKIGGGSSEVIKFKDCVTLCFKSSFDEKRNENLFEVSGNLYNLSLRYFITSSSESWISQIQDMFNVEDYPIEGYTLPETITEMNFNFEFCGLDYRPYHLPLKSYIAIDSLAISSNLTVKGNTSIIMFIIEDAGLFLSQNLLCNEINLKRDYVCVLDVGVFELCMKSDYSVPDFPVTELNVSNNTIHIRTCSDSCKALMELLIYFSNCGDLVQEPSSVNVQHQPHNVIIEPSHTEEMVSSQYKNILNKHDIVANMMQEAMNEASAVNLKVFNDSIVNENEVDLKVDEFFFPGENKMHSRPVSLEDSVHMDMIQALREAQIEDLSDTFQSDYNPNDDDEFCVLDDIPGTGIKSPTGKPKAKYIISQPICIKEGYFDPTTNKPSNKQKCSILPYCEYNLKEMSIVWLMYGGRDFVSSSNDDDDDERNGNKRRSRKISTNSNSSHSSPELSNRKHKEFSVTFCNGDASVVSGRNSPLSLHTSPTTLLKPNANIKWFSVGGPERCHDTLMEINLNKIKFKYELYPEEAPFISQHCFAVNDIVIRDCLASSKINKFLYQPSYESFPKHTRSNMIQIKAVTKKSDPSFTYESNLSISCQPIKLNIDQDALMFLCNFIDSILKADRETDFGREEKPVRKFSHQPVLSLNSEYKSNSNSSSNSQSFSSDKTCDESFCNAPTYFRNVVFSPEVPITIDYHGKHIDIHSQFGAVGGLLIGLGELNHAELTLKKVHIKTGVLGINKLVNCLVNEWINDIKKNQVPSILGGVGPMHSVVKLISGIKDLFWLPIEQYHKDGRVIRGLQRGTSAFTSSSAYALLDLTSRFVGTIQSTAETMYDMVSSGPSVKNKAYKTRKGQPKDIREGVSTAYDLVCNGLGDTANNLIKVATEEHSHKGVSGAVGGLLRQIPPSVVQPIIIASEATCTVIGGMANQLVPDAGKEAAEKWKS